MGTPLTGFHSLRVSWPSPCTSSESPGTLPSKFVLGPAAPCHPLVEPGGCVVESPAQFQPAAVVLLRLLLQLHEEVLLLLLLQSPVLALPQLLQAQHEASDFEKPRAHTSPGKHQHFLGRGLFLGTPRRADQSCALASKHAAQLRRHNDTASWLHK